MNCPSCKKVVFGVEQFLEHISECPGILEVAECMPLKQKAAAAKMFGQEIMELQDLCTSVLKIHTVLQIACIHASEGMAQLMIIPSSDEQFMHDPELFHVVKSALNKHMDELVKAGKAVIIQ